MLTLDTGVGRSFADSMTVAGTLPPKHLPPILRWWYRYDWCFMSDMVAPSHQELAAVLDQHPCTSDSAHLMAKLRIVRSYCQAGVQGFVHAYATEKYDRDHADEFMHELNDGAELGKTSAIYLLRQRLIEKPNNTRLDPVLVLALTIKAWNAWVSGRKLEVLRWSSGGEHPEPFPVFSVDEKRFEKERALRRAKKVAQLQVSKKNALREANGARFAKGVADWTA